jgi:DUF2934 family protein
MSMKPDLAEVARRAYELFLARGSHHGFDRQDWLDAERELSGAAEGSSKKAAASRRRT